MIAAEADSLYVKLFPQDDGEAIARLIEENQDKEARIIDEWRAVCASSFGAHKALSERVFNQIYAPSLRYAYLCLWRRDVPALVSFARSLGDQLARARVPFAAFVAYLHFLRRSYTAVFGDQPEKLKAILTHMEAVHAYLVGICADTYYEVSRAEDEAAREREAAAAAGTDAIPSFHGMVARSAGMHRVFDKIKRVALSGSPVLILGETGTGKELVARAIHECGARRDGPFIAVNCAALPRELIESELFGYRRGAFSGAVTECVGLFRAAAGGTLLLDEITEMAPELQAKLLRVLQDKVVRPVGSVTEIPIDVRVIASSNRDPEEALGAGALRADLYYRLSTSTIVLPPLRARREDIPLLVIHHLRRLREQQGPTAPARRVGREAMALLVAQPWAGNVRELFNVVEDTWAMSASEDIRLDDLQRAARMPTASGSDRDPSPGTFRAAERDLIEDALRSTGGNKLHAARRLGISRSQLYAKMAKFGLVAGAAKRGSGR
jgi:transcriptional regulator with PAS, ATPase and Fis domain